MINPAESGYSSGKKKHDQYGSSSKRYNSAVTDEKTEMPSRIFVRERQLDINGLESGISFGSTKIEIPPPTKNVSARTILGKEALR